MESIAVLGGSDQLHGTEGWLLEFNRETSGLGKLAFLIDLRDPLAVPNVAKMPFLAAV